ncbi:MAG: site-specific integrase [Streptosporangiaceae bacterium]
MTTAAPSTALATIQPVFTDAERLALAGFLAGYRGLTRDAYALDLRQFTTWCRARSQNLFAVRRADIESFARELEARGRARATVTRRLCTIAGFYRYAVEEELLEHSPAAHVRRPRSTTSLTPSGWIVTSSARCWSPPASACRPSTR